MTTNTIFTMMPPDLLKPRQFSGAGRCLTFQCLNITSRFQVLFVFPLLGISKLRFGQRSLRRTEPFRFRDRRPRMYPWDSLAGGRRRQKTEKKISGIQNFFSAFVFGFLRFATLPYPRKRSPWNIQNTHWHQGHAWASVLAKASRVEADTWQLVLQTDCKNQHGSVLDNFLAWRDGREQKRTEAACCFSPAIEKDLKRVSRTSRSRKVSTLSPVMLCNHPGAFRMATSSSFWAELGNGPPSKSGCVYPKKATYRRSELNAFWRRFSVDEVEVSILEFWQRPDSHCICHDTKVNLMATYLGIFGVLKSIPSIEMCWPLVPSSLVVHG